MVHKIYGVVQYTFDIQPNRRTSARRRNVQNNNRVTGQRKVGRSQKNEGVLLKGRNVRPEH